MNIEISQNGPETCVNIFGALDANAVARDRDIADRLTGDHAQAVKIDLDGASFMDASGLGFLSSVLKRARERNCAVQIQNASGQPLAFLKNLGLDRIVTFALDRAPSAGLPIASNVTEFAKAA